MPSKKPKKDESLGYLFPQIAKEWHPALNDNLSPLDIYPATNKNYWWKCSKGTDHEWKTSPNKRTRSGRNCPICSNQKVVLSNCLATTHPKIAEEWHPTKNNGKTPYDIVAGSNKIFWWKCPKGSDHEWEISANSRTGKRQSGCPICSNQKVVLSNCLATTHPKIAQEWHPIKNNGRTPYDIVAGSNKTFWWKCPEGPDHEWSASPSNRSLRHSGCPVCSGQKVVLSNCLATTHPKIALKWHPTKNKNLTPYDVVRYSERKVWWKCNVEDDHEWKSSPHGMELNRCPCCHGKKIVKSNCLATTHPEIAKQWHPTKNKNYNIYNIGINGSQVVWWKCDKADDHEWSTRIVSRKKTGCPFCSNQKVTLSNCLATTHPEIAKEWHPTKNKGLYPNKIVAGSNKNYWWKCERDNNHEWVTSPSNRLLHKTGCPYCTLTPQSREELIITHELITIFKGINPKGFKTRVKGKLRSIDIYIPDLKLGIEFDGSYWHKDKRALDKLKTEELEAEGFNIIRVRQKPLKRIFEDDVMAEKKYDGKKITNDILIQIEKVFKLGSKTKAKIKKYIKKPNLQNEKGLEKYIDMILTEKAEKK